MITGHALDNLVAWFVQICAVSLLGTLLPLAFRIRHPRTQLAFGYGVLVVCLLLPMLQPWRAPADVIAGSQETALMASGGPDTTGGTEAFAEPEQTAITGDLPDPSGPRPQTHCPAPHRAFGLLALKASHVSVAAQHLLEAGKTTGSPQLNTFGPDMALARQMLAAGARDAVLEYLALCEKFWVSGRPQLKAWTDAIRAGGTPTLSARPF